MSVDNDEPASAEEIGESRSLAREYLAMARKALSFLPAGTVKRRRRTAAPLRDEFAEMRRLPNIARVFARVCRRPDCRRRFTCCFGLHRRDRQGTMPDIAPCFEALPKAARFAMSLAIERRLYPESFRDPAKLRREAEILRVVRAELHQLLHGEAADASAFA